MRLGLSPLWLHKALDEIGENEYSPEENPRIVEYGKYTTLKPQTDEIPWCADFVGWCLEESGFESTHSAAAASYEHYGVATTPPKIGSIMVLPHHVTFYVGESFGLYFGLGGNQGNKVCISAFSKTKVLGFRWPR